MQTAELAHNANLVALSSLITHLGNLTIQEAVTILYQVRTKLSLKSELPKRITASQVLLNEVGQLEILRSSETVIFHGREKIAHENFLYAHLFFELIIGCEPFDSTGNIKAAFECGVHLPLSIEQVLNNALLPDSKIVYTSVDQFLILLTHACGIAPLLNPDETLVKRVRGFLQNQETSEQIVAISKSLPAQSSKKWMIFLEMAGAVLVFLGIGILYFFN